MNSPRRETVTPSVAAVLSRTSSPPSSIRATREQSPEQSPTAAAAAAAAAASKKSPPSKVPAGFFGSAKSAAETFVSEVNNNAKDTRRENLKKMIAKEGIDSSPIDQAERHKKQATGAAPHTILRERWKVGKAKAVSVLGAELPSFHPQTGAILSTTLPLSTSIDTILAAAIDLETPQLQNKVTPAVVEFLETEEVRAMILNLFWIFIVRFQKEDAQRREEYQAVEAAKVDEQMSLKLSGSASTKNADPGVTNGAALREFKKMLGQNDDDDWNNHDNSNNDSKREDDKDTSKSVASDAVVTVDGELDFGSIGRKNRDAASQKKREAEKRANLEGKPTLAQLQQVERKLFHNIALNFGTAFQKVKALRGGEMHQKDTIFGIFPDILVHSVYYSMTHLYPTETDTGMFNRKFRKTLYRTVVFWCSGIQPQVLPVSNWPSEKRKRDQDTFRRVHGGTSPRSALEAAQIAAQRVVANSPSTTSPQHGVTPPLVTLGSPQSKASLSGKMESTTNMASPLQRKGSNLSAAGRSNSFGSSRSGAEFDSTTKSAAMGVTWRSTASNAVPVSSDGMDFSLLSNSAHPNAAAAPQSPSKRSSTVKISVPSPHQQNTNKNVSKIEDFGPTFVETESDDEGPAGTSQPSLKKVKSTAHKAATKRTASHQQQQQGRLTSPERGEDGRELSQLLQRRESLQRQRSSVGSMTRRKSKRLRRTLGPNGSQNSKSAINLLVDIKRAIGMDTEAEESELVRRDRVERQRAKERRMLQVQVRGGGKDESRRLSTSLEHSMSPASKNAPSTTTIPSTAANGGSQQQTTDSMKQGLEAQMRKALGRKKKRGPKVITPTLSRQGVSTTWYETGRTHGNLSQERMYEFGDLGAAVEMEDETNNTVTTGGGGGVGGGGTFLTETKLSPSMPTNKPLGGSDMATARLSSVAQAKKQQSSVALLQKEMSAQLDYDDELDDDVMLDESPTAKKNPQYHPHKKATSVKFRRKSSFVGLTNSRRGSNVSFDDDETSNENSLSHSGRGGSSRNLAAGRKHSMKTLARRFEHKEILMAGEIPNPIDDDQSGFAGGAALPKKIKVPMHSPLMQYYKQHILKMDDHHTLQAGMKKDVYLTVLSHLDKSSTKMKFGKHAQKIFDHSQTVVAKGEDMDKVHRMRDAHDQQESARFRQKLDARSKYAKQLINYAYSPRNPERVDKANAAEALLREALKENSKELDDIVAMHKEAVAAFREVIFDVNTKRRNIMGDLAMKCKVRVLYLERQGPFQFKGQTHKVRPADEPVLDDLVKRIQGEKDRLGITGDFADLEGDLDDDGSLLYASLKKARLKKKVNGGRSNDAVLPTVNPKALGMEMSANNTTSKMSNGTSPFQSGQASPAPPTRERDDGKAGLSRHGSVQFNLPGSRSAFAEGDNTTNAFDPPIEGELRSDSDSGSVSPLRKSSAAVTMERIPSPPEAARKRSSAGGPAANRRASLARRTSMKEIKARVEDGQVLLPEYMEINSPTAIANGSFTAPPAPALARKPSVAATVDLSATRQSLISLGDTWSGRQKSENFSSHSFMQEHYAANWVDREEMLAEKREQERLEELAECMDGFLERAYDIDSTDTSDVSMTDDSDADVASTLSALTAEQRKLNGSKLSNDRHPNFAFGDEEPTPHAAQRKMSSSNIALLGSGESRRGSQNGSFFANNSRSLQEQSLQPVHMGKQHISEAGLNRRASIGLLKNPPSMEDKPLTGAAAIKARLAEEAAMYESSPKPPNSGRGRSPHRCQVRGSSGGGLGFGEIPSVEEGSLRGGDVPNIPQPPANMPSLRPSTRERDSAMSGSLVAGEFVSTPVNLPAIPGASPRNAAAPANPMGNNGRPPRPNGQQRSGVPGGATPPTLVETNLRELGPLPPSTPLHDRDTPVKHLGGRGVGNHPSLPQSPQPLLPSVRSPVAAAGVMTSHRAAASPILVGSPNTKSVPTIDLVSPQSVVSPSNYNKSFDTTDSFTRSPSANPKLNVPKLPIKSKFHASLASPMVRDTGVTSSRHPSKTINSDKTKRSLLMKNTISPRADAAGGSGGFSLSSRSGGGGGRQAYGNRQAGSPNTARF